MRPPRLYLQRTFLLIALTSFVLTYFAAVAAAAQLWAAPLDPVTVTRAFAPPPNPYAAGHRGVDLAGHPGEPVVASAAGVVSYAAALAGRGVVVVVHGSLRTTYEPVVAIVKRGVHVERGQQIGTLETGHPGCPVSACLHWGLLRGEQYLDPMKLLLQTQIRLLPLTDVLRQPAAELTRSTATGALTTAVNTPGPSPIAWSVAALAGGGMIFAIRRR